MYLYIILLAAVINSGNAKPWFDEDKLIAEFEREYQLDRDNEYQPPTTFSDETTDTDAGIPTTIPFNFIKWHLINDVISIYANQDNVEKVLLFFHMMSPEVKVRGKEEEEDGNSDILSIDNATMGEIMNEIHVIKDKEIKILRLLSTKGFVDLGEFTTILSLNTSNSHATMENAVDAIHEIRNVQQIIISLGVDQILSIIGKQPDGATAA